MKDVDLTAVQCRHRNQGFALLEVMLAVAVLSIALLALAALQSSMMRNSSDTRTRAIAATIAQSVIDDMRAVQVTKTEDGFRAYEDIVAGSLGDGSFYGGTSTDATVVLTGNSGVAFTSVNWTVNDFWWDQASGSFLTTPPTLQPDKTASYKNVVVTVIWQDESGDPFEVVLEDIISQSSAEDSALLVQQRDASEPPIVGYDANQADSTDIDIPTLGQGGDRSKVTNKPLPDVLRNDFSTITTFSTITFEEGDEDSTFQTVRREEFFILNCQCQYDLSPSGGGRAPTLWNGSGFVLGAEVEDKRTGSVSSSVPGQPALCTQCCRDHHDDGGPFAASRYDPFRPTTDYDDFTGDHNHYFEDVEGALGLAGAGEEYVEACRFVRLDGRLRLTHDFNLAAFNVLPAFQLDPDVGLEDYQEYVIAFVDKYLDAIIALGSDYPATLPDITNPEVFSDLARLTPGTDDIEEIAYSSLEPAGLDLLARGIYIDYLDPDLLTCLKTRRGDIDPVLEGENITAEACRFVEGLDDDAKGGFLDITPFYEVNVSRLANWSWTGDVEVTNEPIAQRGRADICLENNGTERPCRGHVDRTSFATPPASVTVVMENSNTGLIDTDPIDLHEAFKVDPINDVFVVESQQASIEVQTGISNDTVIVKGNLLLSGQVRQVSASDVKITAFGNYTDEFGAPASVECTKPTAGSYRCTIPVPEDKATGDSFPLATVFDSLMLGIRVSNYTGSSADNVENNRVCASGIGFRRRILNNNSIDEQTFLKWQLEDQSYVAFDPDVLDQNVFTLDLLIRTGNGPSCSQSSEGNLSVITL